ncbi:MAG TPA: phytanoyl-CoA dioxygenase family protein [Chitinophagales bacterium]|nr:phytanoyl-CoA dioxygenase family protein [Chitinophagales bacterium]
MALNQQILKDTRLDRRLLEEGYVVVPFLSQAEVHALADYYYASHPRQLDGMYATAHVPDISLRIRMNDFIRKTFARPIEEYFTNCNPLGGSFIAKGKGQGGTLAPHQDWNIVDEDEYRSFNIWVPLVNLTNDNGPIMIIPRSHAWLKNYRSANIHSAFSKVNDAIWKMLQPLFMKAGEALIYDHRLVHASGVNNSGEIRLAAVYGIIPKGARMFYYHKADDHTVEVFESNPEFFLYGNIFEGPKGLKSVGKIKYSFHDVKEQELHRLREADVIQPKPVSAFKKILRAFIAR